jgi:hypothetical protein
MVFLDVADVAIILGLLLGGRITALAELSIKAKWLAFAAIALQLVAFPSDVLPWSTPSAVARVLWVGSYGLLILMLALNYRLLGTPLIAAGLACNLVAIAFNGGLMPVRGSALRAVGRVYHVHNNSIELTRPHLAALVDRWATPGWLPLGNVFSVGDVLIALGTMLVIIAAMRRPATRRWVGAYGMG